jgi:cytochrome c6
MPSEKRLRMARKWDAIDSNSFLRRSRMTNVFVRVGRPLLFVAVGVFLLAATARAQGDAAALYKAKCAACHGADGRGETSMGKVLKVRDLSSDDVQKQTDAQLTGIIENGKGKMPAYKGKLTDDQIKQLVGYIRALKKK